MAYRTQVQTDKFSLSPGEPRKRSPQAGELTVAGGPEEVSVGTPPPVEDRES